MEDDLKLVFINKIGVNHDGRNEYEFYYSSTPDTVWAEDFAEQVPSTCMIEDLLPNADTYSFIRRGLTYTDFNLVQYNSCFSVQDCIDGIINLVWVEESDGSYKGLPFGTNIEDADIFLNECGVEFISEMVVNQDINNEDSEEEVINNNGEVTEDISDKPKEYNDEEFDDDTDLEKLFNGDF